MERKAEEALLALYRDLDTQIAEAGVRCQTSGRCCRFGEYGHTLFLSEMEAELLLEPGIPSGRALDGNSCPYQVGNRCSARDRRPLGCRVYFCDPKFTNRMVELSETFVRRLKSVHLELDRAWRYRPLDHFLESFSEAPSERQEKNSPLAIVELA